MIKQINVLQNNMSVFWMVVAFVVLKSGHIHLVLVGLIRIMTVQQSNENLIAFKSLSHLLMEFLNI